MLIQDWKGAVSQKVNDGMKKLRTFIEKNPEIKTNKHDSTITESLMSKKKNVLFINQLMASNITKSLELVRLQIQLWQQQ